MRKTLSLAALLALGLWLVVRAAPLRAAGLLAVTETATPTSTDTPLPTATSTQTPLPTLPGATATPMSTATASSGGQPPAPSVQDPVITKRADVEHAVIGDAVQFILTVANPNDVEISGVTVSDPLPAQLDFVDGTTTAGTLAYDPAARTVTVAIGALAPRQEVTITLRARVNALGQPPDTITNLALLNFTGVSGQGAALQSNAALVQLVPGDLPATGFGPGPREWASLLVPLSFAGLAALGLGLWVLRRRA
jgi:uncharacterized repeat protein (TIGR01451 family)